MNSYIPSLRTDAFISMFQKQKRTPLWSLNVQSHFTKIKGIPARKFKPHPCKELENHQYTKAEYKAITSGF